MIFAVADTETTGLPFHRAARLDQQPRIIEIAGVITDGVDVLDKFECIVNPGVAIEQIITDITGLTNADLADKPAFKDVIPQVAEFFGKADACIFHNASFDRSMFAYDLQRIGLELDAINWPELTICTVEETMPRYGRRMKLEELYNLHCGEYVQKHRALDDVLLLHQVCIRTGVYSAYKQTEEMRAL
jgi:DNA polymerase III epsilon subunit-like protein